MSMDPEFLRATILKLAFHPDAMKRCQGAVIYAALRGDAFSADEVLVGELTGGDPQLPGAVIGSLKRIGLLTYVGRAKPKSPTRHGCMTNLWALAPGKRSTAVTWLSRNGLESPQPSGEQMELMA